MKRKNLGIEDSDVEDPDEDYEIERDIVLFDKSKR